MKTIQLRIKDLNYLHNKMTLDKLPLCSVFYLENHALKRTNMQAGL